VIPPRRLARHRNGDPGTRRASRRDVRESLGRHRERGAAPAPLEHDPGEDREAADDLERAEVLREDQEREHEVGRQIASGTERDEPDPGEADRGRNPEVSREPLEPGEQGPPAADGKGALEAERDACGEERRGSVADRARP
jgi:hypothetical protein